MDSLNFQLMVARKKKGYTQDQLAEKVGSSRKWLSKIENNQGKPSLELAQKIAAELESTTDELFPK